MGSGRWDAKDWDTHATASSYATRDASDVINTKKVVDDVLPSSFKGGIRESRDSDVNPRSTPIIVAGDVTGSMGELAGQLIKAGLSKFVTEVYDRKPVSDPHILCMAIGDVNYDRVPIQATQFEADLKIVTQLEQLYVERGGGNNDSESYHLPWVLAALMTRHDAWEKRGEKGILFTYGDECVPPPLTRAQIKRYLELDVETDVSAEEALAMALRTYDVYHLIIEQGNHARYALDRVLNSWQALLGQRAIPVADHTKLPEIMTSILQVARAGADKDAVAASWHGGTALVVKRAIDGLVPSVSGDATGSPGAVVAL